MHLCVTVSSFFGAEPIKRSPELKQPDKVSRRKTLPASIEVACNLLVEAVTPVRAALQAPLFGYNAPDIGPSQKVFQTRVNYSTLFDAAQHRSPMSALASFASF